MNGQHFTVLGVHDGHNSSACLLKDGQVVAAIAEERLTRLKNEPGYPRKAIDAVLELSGCEPSDIDMVAIGTKFAHVREFYLGWDWYKTGYTGQVADAGKEQERRKYFLEDRQRERRSTVVEHLGIPAEKIEIVEHHESHAATAYHAAPWIGSGGKTLVLTLDGSGDGICATVNIGENGELYRIAETKSEASLGKIYSRVTYLLGMKPWEHEFKVMGLAPYADVDLLEKSYQVMRPLVELEEGELVFRKGTDLATHYCYPYLQTNLENHRFDAIAGAVQRLTEELVVKWVKNCIGKTGISRVACAGGVFMNVKANMLLMELDEVEDLFVFPSAGDESISFGAAYKVYADHARQQELAFDGCPLETIYLGPEFSDAAIKACIDATGAEEKYYVEYVDDINGVLAKLLASGEIVARFNGKMEWGARALGNRSIITHPGNTDKVKELNAAIKHRDFWMPFAPTILDEAQDRYIDNPKSIESPHMVLAFDTKLAAKSDLRAAIHPYDATARPQVLRQKDNPMYHDLLTRFEAITGVGAFLNTSFNLHGEPIVCTPEDAVSTFDRSGLEILAMNNYLLSKKPLQL